ncbi:ankyrin repeat containing protein [Coccidioides posadasii C735 delta SOWgp]|uniref:Ankyrin repeat protein n=3 Tax=Coccidioides posadasii TaxID=199306 RepID=E9CT51_COCPS|nr:ankyrin repeat containing protein [Coccidioides posadasii C735 delta SOWgp]EER27496.1 ankyrin repeat containing protein [Coccidioides posadasii C735 delta SOWgp]EFW22861.1 ankyrin repeat protein [Coccidioides posadasii str. Silveira]|eukprot:XP_003069641.1 ankyrin repeat containing protein [Coccidioides posadasii C735 delta SOWgp]
MATQECNSEKTQAGSIQPITEALLKHKLVIVTGAGVTLNATQQNSGEHLEKLTWSGLIRHGLRYLSELPLITGPDKDRIISANALLEINSAGSSMDAINIMKGLMTDYNELASWLTNIFSGLKVHQHAILDVLKDLHKEGAILVTTNYDHILDDHGEKLRSISPSDNPDDIRRFKSGHLDGIFHLHGSYDRPQDVILNTTDYVRVVNSEVKYMLEKFLMFDTVLFVGCGAGLNDPNFGPLLNWVREYQKNIPEKHFTLVKKGDISDYRPLRSLIYGQNYSDMASYLRKILEPLPELRRKLNKDTARDNYGSSPSAQQTAPEDAINLTYKRSVTPIIEEAEKAIRLFDAVNKGDFADVHQLLMSGANAKTRMENGWAVFHAAVKGKNWKIIRHLLDTDGTSINTRMNNGWTPLHEAAKGGVKQIVQQLLEEGAIVDARMNDRTYNGRTPLHEAVKKKDIDIVQLLIDKSADVNANFENRWTPLHEAVKRKSKEIVQQLLDNGADLSAKMNSGWTPLHEAAKEGNMEIVQQLLDKGANIDARMDNGWTPLHEAAKQGSTEIVQQLLNNNAKEDARTDNGWTPLHEAANRGSMEIVQQLLDNDANKNARTDSGWTPLHEAVKKKKIDIVQLLIEKDAEVNANFDNRWTPLHEAVKRKSKEIVQQLLDNGADLSAKMNSGWTPLHEAAKEGNMEIVQQLLDKGANTDARMDNGWTPLDEAITGRDITIVQLMTRYRGRDQSSIASTTIPHASRQLMIA